MSSSNHNDERASGESTRSSRNSRKPVKMGCDLTHENISLHVRKEVLAHLREEFPSRDPVEILDEYVVKSEWNGDEEWDFNTWASYIDTAYEEPEAQKKDSVRPLGSTQAAQEQGLEVPEGSIEVTKSRSTSHDMRGQEAPENYPLSENKVGSQGTDVLLRELIENVQALSEGHQEGMRVLCKLSDRVKTLEEGEKVSKNTSVQQAVIPGDPSDGDGGRRQDRRGHDIARDLAHDDGGRRGQGIYVPKDLAEGDSGRRQDRRSQGIAIDLTRGDGGRRQDRRSQGIYVSEDVVDSDDAYGNGGRRHYNRDPGITRDLEEDDDDRRQYRRNQGIARDQTYDERDYQQYRHDQGLVFNRTSPEQFWEYDKLNPYQRQRHSPNDDKSIRLAQLYAKLGGDLPGQDLFFDVDGSELGSKTLSLMPDPLGVTSMGEIMWRQSEVNSKGDPEFSVLAKHLQKKYGSKIGVLADLKKSVSSEDIIKHNEKVLRHLPKFYDRFMLEAVKAANRMTDDFLDLHIVRQRPICRLAQGSIDSFTKLSIMITNYHHRYDTTVIDLIIAVYEFLQHERVWNGSSGSKVEIVIATIKAIGKIVGPGHMLISGASEDIDEEVRKLEIRRALGTVNTSQSIGETTTKSMASKSKRAARNKEFGLLTFSESNTGGSQTFKNAFCVSCGAIGHWARHCKSRISSGTDLKDAVTTFKTENADRIAAWDQDPNLNDFLEILSR